MAIKHKVKAVEPITGLARQEAYLSGRKQTGLTSDSFFITDKVMESMRDSGYRDIRKAINDLIDNSQQAGAKKIAVVTTSGKSQEKNAREKVNNIAVIDDGHGMLPEMLPYAIAWGGTDRHDQRDGLGRFGFGLPTAAISVTRTYRVLSKVKGGKWYQITVNLDEIAKKALQNGGMVAHTPNTEIAVFPKFVKDYIKKNWGKEDLEQGTIVLLENPDRIRSFATPPTFHSKMMQNIGLTYRHFIPGLTFYVNESKVEVIDPLFLNPNCQGYDVGNGYKAEGFDEINIPIKNTFGYGKEFEGNIKLRFSFMHPGFQRNKDNELIKNRFHTMKENNGYFIVCRSGRQIDVVTDPHYQSEPDNISMVNFDRNWAIELDFDPKLDELFGITTNKQQVEIDDSLWDIFKANGIPDYIKAFRKKFINLRSENIQQKVNIEKDRESENIMRDAEKVDKLKIPAEKKIKANERVREKAKEIAPKNTKDIEPIVEELLSNLEKKTFKVEFTNYPGAPFYEVELWGPQIVLQINIAHNFYSNIYSQLDTRGKTALELFLFVLGRCEIESDEEKQLFYGNERFEWSRKLELRLKLLDKKDPIVDKQSSDADE